MGTASAPIRLMLVTDRAATGARDLREVVAAAVASGVDAVQVRERGLSDSDLLHLCQEIAAVCHAAGARLLVNDRLDVALACDADGVHLPAAGIPVAKARRHLAEGKLVGISTHTFDEARAAEQAGADYVILGPAFPTPVKTDAVPLGVAGLRDIIGRLQVPVLAIGGITAENAAAVMGAGAAGVAVIRALVAAPDPRAAAAALRRVVA